MQGQAPACPQRCPSGRAEAPGSRAAAGRRAAMLCTLDAGGARPQAARSSSDRRGRPRRRLTNTEAPHLVNGVGGSAAGRTGAFAFYVSRVRTPLLHGLKTVVPPVDQGSAVGRGYGPAPHASRALRVPAGPASPALDPRVPAGPGQG